MTNYLILIKFSHLLARLNAFTIVVNTQNLSVQCRWACVCVCIYMSQCLFQHILSWKIDTCFASKRHIPLFFPALHIITSIYRGMLHKFFINPVQKSFFFPFKSSSYVSLVLKGYISQTMSPLFNCDKVVKTCVCTFFHLLTPLTVLAAGVLRVKGRTLAKCSLSAENKMIICQYFWY